MRACTIGVRKFPSTVCTATISPTTHSPSIGSCVTASSTAGTPTAQHKKIAKDLYATYEKFCKYTKPGMTFANVFDYIRGEMVEMGYPARKTGFPCQQFAIHGIGLGPFHDFPHPTHRETVFEPGMVLSFQPSVRHDDFTIRFEDNLLVTDSGVELLSHFPRELI